MKTLAAKSMCAVAQILLLQGCVSSQSMVFGAVAVGLATQCGYEEGNRTSSLLLPAGLFSTLGAKRLYALTIAPLGNNLIILSQTPVQGRACFNMAKAAVFMSENVFDAAVADALAKHGAAMVLANAEFMDDGSCVEVSGLPARFYPEGS